MRRILTIIFAVSLALSIHAQGNDDIIISKSKGSITFKVDGDLPKPQNEIRAYDDIADKWAKHDNVGKVIATSWRGKILYLPGYSTFFNCLCQAYAEHRSVILSPDVIWTLIGQGFSHYVNLNPEAMRDKLVNHAGKLTLTVESKNDLYGSNVDWEGILNGFDKQIDENTKSGFASMMRADFSTTCKTERIASQITMMSTVKAFFDFAVFYMSCGIPSITIEGTPDDWKKVIEKSEGLRKYDLGWWIDDLTPVLQEFVKAAEGNPNVTFWRNIVKKNRPLSIEGGGCSDEEPTRLDGWFLKLMPFDKNGRTPESVAHDTEDMLPEMVCADFVYHVTDLKGDILSTTPMTMIGGIAGIEVNKDKNTMRPKIGWMVCERNDDIELKKKLTTKTIQGSVPEGLREIGYLPRVTILTTNTTSPLPEWMDTIKIDEINVYFYSDTLSPNTQADIEKRFSDRDLTFTQDVITIRSRTCMAPEDYIFETYDILRDQEKKKFYIETAEYPGGIDSLKVYFAKNRSNTLGQQCKLSFVVEKDGSISNVKVNKKNIHNVITPQEQLEAEQILKNCPAWKPAMMMFKKTKKDKKADRKNHPVRSRIELDIAI